MPEMTTPPDESDVLRERVQKLGRDKSNLQLVLNLVSKVSVVQGVDNMVGALLENVLNLLGGTNVMLYYLVEGDMHYADIFGDRKHVSRIDDPQILQVMEDSTPMQWEQDFSATGLTTPEFTKAYTWVFPLLAGRQLVGIFKLENLHVGMLELYEQLPVFFSYVASLLKNELMEESRLKQAYDDLSHINTALALEINVRKKAEHDLRMAKEHLQERVEERTSELCSANERLQHELSERARAEEALRISEDNLRSLFDAIQESVCLLDSHGRLIALNNTFAKRLGRTVEECKNMIVYELVPPDIAENRKRIVDGVFATGVPALFEDERDSYWLYHSIMPIQSRDGVVKRVAVFAMDITERKRTDLALLESEKRLELALEGAGEGIVDWDLRTDRILVSPTLASLQGFSEEEFPKTGTDFLRLIHPDDKEISDIELDKLLTGRAPHLDMETRFLTRSGDWKWILARGKVVERDDSGRALRYLGTHVDINERKSLENELQHAQKMESVGRLAGGVAHDFNNMLGVIFGHAELALEQVEPGHPLRSDLLQIHTAAQRSADLTRQLLAFARKQTVAPKIINLNDTVTGMSNMLQRLIGEEVHLECRLSENLWSAKVDPSQMDQIIANLCLNARDSIAGTGKIVIETANYTLDEEDSRHHEDAKPGDYIRISVMDTGIGMTKDTLTHIFEPFFTTKGQGKGTGLGLAMVYGAMKQNDGFVSADSEPGVGSTFRLYLPRHVGTADNPDFSTLGKQSLSGHETILVVEDETAILQLAQKTLELQGYTVLAADDPITALRLARAHSGEIDLLVTDVVMPGMNGRELSEKLLDIYPAVSLLFMSGYTADVIAHHGVLNEGLNFLQKPFTSKGLAAKVREVLEASSSPKSLVSSLVSAVPAQQSK